MTCKSLLLGTTAFAGAALMAVPAMAAPAMSGDNYTVELSGTFGYNVMLYSQDVSAGLGRGYQFKNYESELYVHAGAKADNGVKYGVRMVLNSNTDDTTVSDEIWAYMSHDNWGHLELGDNDSAADRMFVNAEAVMVGNVAWDGILFDVVSTGTGGGITDSFVSTTDDATKIVYFTPRIAGFQLGASLTPDAGHNGQAFGTRDDIGNQQSVFEFGANWEGKFGDVGLVLSGTYETGTQDNGGTPTFTPMEDPETWSVGGQVTFRGFAIAAGYADFANTGITTAAAAAGADGGQWWDVGASYETGPWKVSLAWLDTTKDNVAGSGSTDWSVISGAVGYAVAPGWDVAAELDRFSGKNVDATAIPVDNQGYVLILSNYFNF